MKTRLFSSLLFFPFLFSFLLFFSFLFYISRIVLHRVCIVLARCLHGVCIVSAWCRLAVIIWRASNEDPALVFLGYIALAALHGVEVALLYAPRCEHLLAAPKHFIEQSDVYAGLNEVLELLCGHAQLLRHAKHPLLGHLDCEAVCVDGGQQLNEPAVGGPGRAMVVIVRAVRHAVAVLQIEYLVIVLRVGLKAEVVNAHQLFAHW